MINRPHVKSPRPNEPWEDAECGIAVCDPLLGQHEVEQNVWRELQQASGGHFSSLIVRRVPNGVCLQGVLEIDDEDFLGDVDDLVRRVACVDRVLNQVVVRDSRPA